MKIVIDMGGTNTRIAYTEDSKTFTSIDRFPTPQSQADSHKLFLEAFAKNSINPENIIFGIAGVVDYPSNMVVSVTNIKWINNMSASEIIGISDMEIKSHNDAELAGLAEAYQPYATNFENVAYITISTGVGGTIIRNKKPVSINRNFEPGHFILDRSSYIENPSDGIQGSFENLCSGTAFKKLYGVEPQNCTDQAIWQKYGADLADGLHNVTLLWQPDAIVLGGSMTKQWDYFYNTLIEKLNSLQSYYKKTEIIKSELDDTNGLIGGLKV